MNEIREWLDRLYGRSPGYFAITAFAGGRPRRTVWHETSELDAAVRTIKKTRKGDLYLSVGTHDAPQRTRGGENTIISIPGLWADLDIGELGHKPAASGLPNPADEETALSIVEGLPSPSMVLNSGGGLQGFWLFDEPWVFSGPEDKLRAKKAIVEWGNLLATKGQELGYHVDKVADLARILRTPGSLNHKEGVVRPIEIRWHDKPAHDRESLVVLGVPDDSYSEEPSTSNGQQTDSFGMTWDEILLPHGYTKCGDRSWVRPGKKCGEGISLSHTEDAPFVITNWSETDDRLPVGRGTKLTKYKTFALLNGEEKAKKVMTVGPPRKIKLTPASSIQAKPVRWLWKGRVAIGTLALLAGREGIGKSTLAYTLVAEITKGKLEGVYTGQPRGVIIVATEDSWEFTIVPRLKAAGADLDRVFRAEPEDEDEYGISLPRDVRELSELAKEQQIALILLDPLMSRLDSKLDTHKDSEVRQALEPLVRMAEASQSAVIGLMHVNKGGSSDPLTSLMGSRAFSAVSRAVLFVMEDPDDRNIKIMSQQKNNLGRSDLPEKTYTIHEKGVDEFEGEIITSAYIKWGEDRDTGYTRDTMSTKHTSSRTDDAILWLTTYLTQHGRSPKKEIEEEAKKEGFSSTMLSKAKLEAGVSHEREGFGAGSTMYWTLPGIPSSGFLFEEEG